MTRLIEAATITFKIAQAVNGFSPDVHAQNTYQAGVGELGGAQVFHDPTLGSDQRAVRHASSAQDKSKNPFPGSMVFPMVGTDFATGAASRDTHSGFIGRMDSAGVRAHGRHNEIRIPTRTDYMTSSQGRIAFDAGMAATAVQIGDRVGLSSATFASLAEMVHGGYTLSENVVGEMVWGGVEELFEQTLDRLADRLSQGLLNSYDVNKLLTLDTSALTRFGFGEVVSGTHRLSKVQRERLADIADKMRGWLEKNVDVTEEMIGELKNFAGSMTPEQAGSSMMLVPLLGIVGALKGRRLEEFGRTLADLKGNWRRKLLALLAPVLLITGCAPGAVATSEAPAPTAVAAATVTVNETQVSIPASNESAPVIGITLSEHTDREDVRTRIVEYHSILRSQGTWGDYDNGDVEFKEVTVFGSDKILDDLIVSAENKKTGQVVILARSNLENGALKMEWLTAPLQARFTIGEDGVWRGSWFVMQDGREVLLYSSTEDEAGNVHVLGSDGKWVDSGKKWADPEFVRVAGVGNLAALMAQLPEERSGWEVDTMASVVKDEKGMIVRAFIDGQTYEVREGIAKDDADNHYVYDAQSGDWNVLADLPGDGNLDVIMDGENVVAVDADGEVAFEYDMATDSWVEVNTLPDWVRALESAGNTVDAERGIVYDADGKVLGATGADGEWNEYPNGMVPLEAQDGSGEPPLDVPYAENFEDAIALVTKRLPWNNPTVYAKPTAEQAAQAQLRYDRYLRQITEPEGWSPRVRSIEVRLYETGNPKNWVIVYVYERLIPGGRIVTSMNFNTSDRSKVMVFIDTDAVRLVAQLQAGDHGYEIVGP